MSLYTHFLVHPEKPVQMSLPVRSPVWPLLLPALWHESHILLGCGLCLPQCPEAPPCGGSALFIFRPAQATKSRTETVFNKCLQVE